MWSQLARSSLTKSHGQIQFTKLGPKIMLPPPSFDSEQVHPHTCNFTILSDNYTWQQHLWVGKHYLYHPLHFHLNQQYHVWAKHLMQNSRLFFCCDGERGKKKIKRIVGWNCWNVGKLLMKKNEIKWCSLRRRQVDRSCGWWCWVVKQKLLRHFLEFISYVAVVGK